MTTNTRTRDHGAGPTRHQAASASRLTPFRRLGRPTTRLTLAHAAMVTAGLATFVTVGSVLADRQATVEVVVLAADAAPGTDWLDLEVKVASVPADTPFLEAMIAPDDLGSGMAIARAATAGQPLRRSDFVPAGAGELTRTATVAVESSTIAGLGLVVGDRVDVIGLDDTDRAILVVGDLRVSRLPSSGTGDGLLSGPSAAFVTVEVETEQALALVSAQQRGSLELLRSTGATPLPQGLSVSGEERQ